MNPVPSDAQWLVLYLIDEGDVFLDGTGTWRATYNDATGAARPVSGMVRRLYQLGLVDYVYRGTPGEDVLTGVKVNKLGMDVLKRRSAYDVISRLNKRTQG